MSAKDTEYEDRSSDSSGGGSDESDNLLDRIVDYFSSGLAYLGDNLTEDNMDSNSSSDNIGTRNVPFTNRKYPLFEVRAAASNETITNNGTTDSMNITTSLVNSVHIVPKIINDLSTVNWNATRAAAATTTTTTTSTTMINDIMLPPRSCYSSPEEYEIIPAMLCSSLFVLGIVYILYGYRCFRAISFITGLIFGCLAAHSFLVIDKRTITLGMLPYGNVITTLASGLALALLSALVIFVGLFVVGFNLGALFGVSVLIVIYLCRPYYPALEPPLSLATLLIFLVSISLVGSIATLYFSKGCTIIATSLYGSALALLCVDYFVENFRVLYWVVDQMSNGVDDWGGLLLGMPRGEGNDCLGTRIVLGAWPVLTLVGIIVQVTITARGVHYDGYGLIITNEHRRRAANQGELGFPESPLSYHKTGHQHDLGGGGGGHRNRRRCPEETQLEQRHKKYRYLYQVRTAHGDVISQNYLHSMQNKKLCPQEHDNYTFNSDLSSHFMPSESRTTTLSVA